MNSIENIIKTGGLEFYSNNKKLDANLKEFGEYNWDLARHLAKQTSEYLVVNGSGLEEFLGKQQNVQDLTEFIVQLLGEKYKNNVHLKTHVNADIESIQNKYYKNEKEIILRNYLGKSTCDVMKWTPELSWFENLWNVCLCSSIGGFVGYPGYEWPRSRNEFKYEILAHTRYCVIGTKKQLLRYNNYAKQWIDNYTKQVSPNARVNTVEEIIKAFT